MASNTVEQILKGWLSGAERVNGKANPAGSLFVGGVKTLRSLTDATDIHYTGHCSSCSSSYHVACC